MAHSIKEWGSNFIDYLIFTDETSAKKYAENLDKEQYD